MLSVIGLTFSQLPHFVGLLPTRTWGYSDVSPSATWIVGAVIGSRDAFLRIGLTFSQLPLFVGLLPTRTWGYSEVSPSATWGVGGERE